MVHTISVNLRQFICWHHFGTATIIFHIGALWLWVWGWGVNADHRSLTQGGRPARARGRPRGRWVDSLCNDLSPDRVTPRGACRRPEGDFPSDLARSRSPGISTRTSSRAPRLVPARITPDEGWANVCDVGPTFTRSLSASPLADSPDHTGSAGYPCPWDWRLPTLWLDLMAQDPRQGGSQCDRSHTK